MKKKLLLILAILFTATSLFAMKLYLTNTSSAGQAQADPNASLGGYRSTTELSATSMKNLFDDVSIVEALLGDVEYRMVDIYNDGADPVYKAQFYMQSQTSSPGTVLSFGYSATNQPHADNWNGEALSNESTAPASPSMTFYDFTKTAPLALGTIPAGQSKRVCVKRTVTADAPWTAHDLGRFGLKWGGVAAAACSEGTYDLMLQNFEGSTNCLTASEPHCDNSALPWTVVNGAVDWNYTTAPLRGVSSIQLNPTADWAACRASIASNTTVWVHVRVRYSALPAADQECIFKLQTVAEANIQDFRVTSAGALWVQNANGTYTSANSLFAANTTYHLWLGYEGAAVNSHLHVYIGTTGTRSAATLAIDQTTGSINAACTILRLQMHPQYAATGLFDQIYVNTAEIVDVCE